MLKGETPGSNAESLALAQLASEKALHTTATRLWPEAFEANPNLAEDRHTHPRYNAAYSAALEVAARGMTIRYPT